MWQLMPILLTFSVQVPYFQSKITYSKQLLTMCSNDVQFYVVYLCCLMPTWTGRKSRKPFKKKYPIIRRGREKDESERPFGCLRYI